MPISSDRKPSLIDNWGIPLLFAVAGLVLVITRHELLLVVVVAVALVILYGLSLYRKLPPGSESDHDSRSLRLILPVSVTAAVLLLGYVWSFSALSKPVFLWDGDDRGWWVGVEYPPLDKAELIEDRSAWGSFFAPMEWLGRRIRPRRWSADFLNLLPDRLSRRRPG